MNPLNELFAGLFVAQVEQERVAQVVDVLGGLQLGDPRREHLKKERQACESNSLELERTYNSLLQLRR
jgi:hypothetical protein